MKAKSGQHITAVEFVQDRQLAWKLICREHNRRAVVRSQHPDESSAGLEIATRLPLRSRVSIGARHDLDGKVGRKWYERQVSQSVGYFRRADKTDIGCYDSIGISGQDIATTLAGDVTQTAASHEGKQWHGDQEAHLARKPLRRRHLDELSF